MRLVSIAVVLFCAISLVLSQTVAPADVRDRSCEALLANSDERALCDAASSVDVEEQANVEPGARELQEIETASRTEVSTTFSPWFTVFVSGSCPTTQLQNMSDALGAEIRSAQARIAEAQANVTAEVASVLAGWRERYANFTAIVQQFQPPAVEPPPRVKLVLFVTGFQLMQERRMIEISILRVRLMFAIAEVSVNHLRTRKTVIDFLINTTCANITDRANVEDVVLTLVRAKRVFEYRAAKLEQLVQAFLARHMSVMTKLRQRVDQVEAGTYRKGSEVVQDWSARKDAVADTIRRAVIAYFDNVTRVTVTVTPNGPGERPTVSISFDRTVRQGDLPDRLKTYIARIVRTAVASESGADETKDIEVSVSDPTTLKRQAGQASQAFTVTSTINNSSASALALSALLLLACALTMM
jgi:hypothetical protein